MAIGRDPFVLHLRLFLVVVCFFGFGSACQWTGQWEWRRSRAHSGVPQIGLVFVRPERGTAVVSSNSFKFVMLPPQTDTTRAWARRLAEAVPEVRVVVAEDAAAAAREIADAEAAFGWLGKELLSKATKLRWLQAPQ